jgi:outer membrane immunogenic protein
MACEYAANPQIKLRADIAMTRTNCSMLAAGAPLLLALGVPALGADMAVKAPPFTVPLAAPYSWTGWYIGANAGYGVGQRQGEFARGSVFETFNAEPAGAFGGGQLGFNYQIMGFVLGAETDIQGAGISDTRTCLLNCFAGSAALIDQKLNWFGTTRARIGLANGPVLTYATAGAAYGGTETDLATTLGGVTNVATTTTTKTGWVWGTGVEAALGGNWTAKAEYLYLNLGSSAVASPATGTFVTKTQEQIFRGGINYRFGADQSAALGPIYNWAGPFVGGTFGFGLGRNDSTLVIPATTAESFVLSPRGFDGGGIAGYNWQFGSWVVGVDADFQGSGGSGYLTCVNLCGAHAIAIDQKLSWFSTVRGRLGYAVGPALFYATAGGAFAEVKENIAQPGAGSAFSHSQSGFAAGGGIENKLDFFGLLGPRWTTRTEYLYLGLGSISDTVVGSAPQTLTSNLHEHVWRTVVSYKFGSP